MGSRFDDDNFDASTDALMDQFGESITAQASGASSKSITAIISEKDSGIEVDDDREGRLYMANFSIYADDINGYAAVTPKRLTFTARSKTWTVTRILGHSGGLWVLEAASYDGVRVGRGRLRLDRMNG